MDTSSTLNDIRGRLSRVIRPMHSVLVFRILALFIASEIPAAYADEDAIQKEIKTELTAQAQALGEMLRQDVEDVRVLIEQVANVSLPVTGGEVAPCATGSCHSNYCGRPKCR